MRKKGLVLIIAILGICIFKFMNIELYPGQAEAASAVPTTVKIQKTAKPLPKNPPRQRATASKKTAPLVTEKNTESRDEEDMSNHRVMSRQEIYCRMLAAGLDVEDVDLKLQSYQYSLNPAAGEVQVAFFAQTPSCPKGLYSKYELDKNNRILNFTDCHETTIENLSYGSGSQGRITYHDPQKNKVRVAISGWGMFAIQCKDGIRYTRNGDWNFNPDGSVSTKFGDCQVLNRQGRAIRLKNETDLNDQGCNRDGECLGVAQLEPGQFKVLDRDTFLPTEDPLNLLSKDPDDVRLFQSNLEDLKDPEGGLIGPDFDALPYVDKPAWCPESFD